MKAHEAAKMMQMSSKDFCKEYGLKSHLSNVPTDLEAEILEEGKKNQEAKPQREEIVDKAKEVVVAEPMPVVKTDECPVDLKTLKISLKGAGAKSPYWKWRHLLNA